MLMILPLLLTTVSAGTAPCMVGTWDLKASDQAIFRLDIQTTPGGMTVMWERPHHFRMDAESFSQVSGPIDRSPTKGVRLVGDDVELSFYDPSPGRAPDISRLHCVDSDHLEVDLPFTGFEPFNFVRAQANEHSLGPWDAARTYVRAIIRPTNVEMTAIFDADQADRPDDPRAFNGSVVGARDEKRRIRTQELLDAGALRSGDDFYHAAFVFQHGRTAGDFLKAHLLAMIATARGSPDAIWIASATLDRYLQTIGKPQVLGTQFMLPKGAPATQEPYDRTLASDALRKALHVPPMSEQEEQRRKYAEPQKP